MSEPQPQHQQQQPIQQLLQQEQFVRDGYLVCRQVLPRETVLAWSERYGSSQFFNHIFEQLYRHGHTPFPQHCRRPVEGNNSNDAIVLEYALGRGVRHGFKEIVMRSPGRYEIAIAPSDDLRSALLATVRQALPWVPQLLLMKSTTMPDEKNNITTTTPTPTPNENDNDNHNITTNITPPATPSLPTWDEVRIIQVSVVISTPGAPAQGWHADGGHVDLHRHLPCHCLALFLPLIDIDTVDLGPTELRPGSHYHTRNLVPLMLAAKARRTWRPPVAPLLQRGDCLILDYRLLHRGLAHSFETTKTHRPILIVTVAQPWFRDVVNVPSRSLYDSTTLLENSARNANEPKQSKANVNDDDPENDERGIPTMV